VHVITAFKYEQGSNPVPLFEQPHPDELVESALGALNARFA